MTWTYQVSGGGDSMDIFDHTGALIKTVQNDGSGFSLPRDVLDVMRAEAKKARKNNDTERWRDIHIRIADNDLERQ
jgi:hypothetical protein